MKKQFKMVECGDTEGKGNTTSLESVAVIYVRFNFNVFSGGALQARTRKSICLGTLVDQRTVLSASSCFTRNIKYTENNIEYAISSLDIDYSVYMNAKYFNESQMPAIDKYGVSNVKVLLKLSKKLTMTL